MDLVEHLGVVGPLGVIPLEIGWGASVELIGLVDFPMSIALSLVAGLVTLPIGVTGSIDSTFTHLKESEGCEQNFPSKFHGCASATSSKCEGRDLGLIIDLVFLNMELSGNLTQYESGSAAGWSTVVVFQMFPLTSLTKTGCTGSNSMWAPVEVLGCLLSNSSQILEVSMFFPILNEICGRIEHGLLPVNISNGDGRVKLIGVVLYCISP